MVCCRFGFSTKVRKLMKNEERRMKNSAGKVGKGVIMSGKVGLKGGWKEGMEAWEKERPPHV